MSDDIKKEQQTPVCWLLLTVEDLAGIKPGSALARKVGTEALNYLSAWRPAYINAVERTVINEDLLVDENAAISEPTGGQDGFSDEGAYVMCWQFIPHAAVIPPNAAKISPTDRELWVVREVAKIVETKE